MNRARRKPTIAAVIPTYNRRELLTYAIESVLGQTLPPDVVVVVNDGCTDGTQNLIESYSARIRWLRQRNKGKAAAINNALNHIASDYVWVMDDDDCAFPDALERHLAFLESHPQVDFSYSGLYFFKGNARPPPLSRCVLWQPPDVGHAHFFIRAMELFPANLQTMLVPRSCYQRVGAFDEAMKFSEDYDLILRLARQYRAARLPEPTIFLRRHSGARGPAAERWGAERKLNAWRLYNKTIFRGVRRKLAFNEYLPRGRVDGHGLTQLQMRGALLQRACIMARRGLYHETLEDLSLCIRKFSGNMRLTSEERAVCARMLNFDDEVQPLSGRFVRDVARLLWRRCQRDSDLRKYVLAGLYWGLLREVRAGNYPRAGKLSLHLMSALILIGGARARQFARYSAPRYRQRGGVKASCDSSCQHRVSGSVQNRLWTRK
jgi:glycosyltransferase involved in cell wall biosynthesis